MNYDSYELIINQINTLCGWGIIHIINITKMPELIVIVATRLTVKCVTIRRM